MTKPSFLPLLRELTECYLAFESFSGAHVRSLKLTPAQFDILVTLGNTNGMTCKELGERSLITKGTLTGVMQRLEAKGLVTRDVVESDGRAILTRLSKSGERLFQKVFPAHLTHLQPAFQSLAADEMQTLVQSLRRLHESLRLAVERHGAAKASAKPVSAKPNSAAPALARKPKAASRGRAKTTAKVTSKATPARARRSSRIASS